MKVKNFQSLYMSYRYMRLIVMFDLSTLTASDRRMYRQFHKFLISEGFIMFQYSIYSKIFLNNTNKESIIKRLQSNAPKSGNISILSITEKQFAKMIYLSGQKNTSVANSDARLVILGEDEDD